MKKDNISTDRDARSWKKVLSESYWQKYLGSSLWMRIW